MQRHSRIEVARLLPPGSVSVDLVSQEPHISVATLERWRAAASEAPRKADKGWLWTFVPGAKEGNWAVAYHFGDNRTCEKARACWMIGGASWSAMTSAVTRRDFGREVGCTAGRCRPSVTPCRSWTVRNPRADRLQRAAVWPGAPRAMFVKKSRAFWAGCGVCETLGGQVAGQQGSGGLVADRRMSGGLSLLRCLARRRQEAKGVRGGE